MKRIEKVIENFLKDRSKWRKATVLRLDGLDGSVIGTGIFENCGNAFEALLNAIPAIEEESKVLDGDVKVEISFEDCGVPTTIVILKGVKLRDHFRFSIPEALLSEGRA